MIKKILIISFVLFISCVRVVENDSNQKDETQTHLIEDKAIQKIKDFYKNSKSESFYGVEHNNLKYIDITLKGHQNFDSYSENSNILCSNIAYLLFSNLKDKKEKYDEFRINVQLSDNSIISKKFKKKYLKSIESRIKKNFEFVELFTSNNIDNLIKLLNNEEVFEYSKKELKENVKEIIQQIKPSNQYAMIGFEEVKPGKKEVFKVINILNTEKGEVAFSVYMNLPTDSEIEVYFFEFKK
jgi:hypothetical protein